MINEGATYHQHPDTAGHVIRAATRESPPGDAARNADKAIRSAHRHNDPAWPQVNSLAGVSTTGKRARPEIAHRRSGRARAGTVRSRKSSLRS